MQSFYKPMDEAERADWRARRRAAWDRLSPEHQNARQVLGKRITIGCVALEITQRCNLDCTLCYLSELSESIPDPPLEEIKRRADLILRDWGPNTNVQITGGDPTLRKRSELVEIVRYCRSIGLLPALFTNGIKARRDLLVDLCRVGLTDVAFHVDLTQERPGYKTETDLNAIREEYIERARGLPLAVVFNTTVCRDNIHEVPDLVRFFRKHADVVGMCSFQLEADTGRGVLRDGYAPGLPNMRELVGRGFDDAPLSWEAVQFGHPKCHSIVYTLQAGDHSIDLNDDIELVEDMLRELPDLEMDRTQPLRAAATVALGALSKPRVALKGLRWLGRKLRDNFVPIARAGFKVHKLSVFIQNFQGRDELDPDRIQNCSFMVATHDGTVSMCLHNARRDEFITVGVDRLLRKPAPRGAPRERDPHLPTPLQGPIAPGAAGLPLGPGTPDPQRVTVAAPSAVVNATGGDAE
ncbi:MAG: radical SAM protein [Deltaproteobacteria bacterium]|nr:radical SAM protein [Deltaproteobacteria bacterium]